LQKFNELLDKKEIKFKYIMIDEFQDTNSFQYEIIKKLKYDNFFIVGDEKQSIYAFQGEEIEVFKSAKNELAVKPLEINYRSDKEIIDFINKIFKEIFKIEDLVIENDFSATFEKLKANNQNGGEVELLVTTYEKDDKLSAEEKKILEAQNIAYLVKEIIEGKRYSHLQDYIQSKNHRNFI